MFSLIKQFLSLVSKVLGYELEVKGTKWLAHRCSSHTEDELCEFSIHGGLWSTACFPRLRTLDSWTCSGIGLVVHTTFLPQPPGLAWDWCVLCFVEIFSYLCSLQILRKRAQKSADHCLKETYQRSDTHLLGVSSIKCGYRYNQCGMQSSRSYSLWSAVGYMEHALEFKCPFEK